MTMTPANTDLLQAMKWQQNQAPNIQKLIEQKAAWYVKNSNTFWSDWEKNVFDIKTATPFGMMVWCIILGLNGRYFGLYPKDHIWAFGDQRQNFVWSGSLPAPEDASEGGNFYGGGTTQIFTFDEVRKMLQLRYVALISDGRIAFINRMLRYIFNNGQPWDDANSRHFYLMDSTGSSDPQVSDLTVYHEGSLGRWPAMGSARVNHVLMSVATADGQWPNWGAPISFQYGQATDPAGGNTAVTVTKSANTIAAAQISIDRVIQPGQVITASFYARKLPGDTDAFVSIGILGDGGRADATFNLTNGEKAGFNSGSAEIINVDSVPVGTLGYFRVYVTMRFNQYVGRRIIMAPADNQFAVSDDKAGSSSPRCQVWGFQMEYLDFVTSYNSSAGSATSRQDYTLTNATAGTIVYNYPIGAGTSLFWTGNWKSGRQQVPKKFADGDATTTTWTLSNPDYIAAPTAGAFQLEYRIGRNMNLSSQLVNVLRDQTSGILPRPSGSTILVIQE